MKLVKYMVLIIVGAVLAFIIMCYRGLLSAIDLADTVLIICDGFTVTAFLYLSIGSLIWFSTTGFFDIFGYAFQKGAHAIIPGLFKDRLGGYYEYKLDKQNKRKSNKDRSALITGAGFLLIVIILTVIWYQLVE